MTNKSQIDTPVWISDHEDVRRLLSDFLDKVDKGTRLLIRLTPNTVPSLFDFNNSESGLIWSLIQMLEKDFGIITIEPERAKAGKEVYDNAKVRFNQESEELVRHWLHRPKQTPYKEQWRQAVISLDWPEATNISFIAANPIKYLDKTASEIVTQLEAAQASLSEPQTLRALSAKHIWGDSKFLDNRQEYLGSAFPHLQGNILTRPVLVNLFIPEHYSSVLFIENQDTFLMLTSNLMAMSDNSIAIVYTAGYRGTATRIRDNGSYVFSALSQTCSETTIRFTRWWELQSAEDIPTFFWGDLDYSGLGILCALRSTFDDMTAWRPGYDVMLQHHANGISHPISSDNKGTQTDPGDTGCTYSDNVLLPAIRKNERFLDQEIVTFIDIQEHFTINWKPSQK